MAGTIPPSDNRVGFSVYAGLEERAQDPELKKVLSRLRKVTAADVARLAPEIRNPLLSSVNFYIPAERSILNQWIRYYDRFHPLVGNAIDLHSELPLSRFGLKGLADTSKLNFYMEMVEEMDLYIFMLDMAREYFLLGECLKPGSLVTVEGGLEQRIESLSSGDKVLTHTGKLSSVQYVMHRNYIGDMYSIMVRGLPHTPLNCTGNHPLLVAMQGDWKCPSGLNRFCNSELTDRCQQKKSSKHFNVCSEEKFASISRTVKFVKAEDVKEGDYVASAFDETVVDASELTPGVCKLFGYYLSEGCITYNNSHTVRTGVNIANIAKDVVEEVAILFSEEFDVPRLGIGTPNKRLGRDLEEWVKIDLHGPCCHVKVKSKRVAELFHKHCGEFSHTKKVSSVVMSLPSTKQLDILKRFCVGDGWVDNGRITMGSVSKDLMTQMYYMSLRGGMVPSYFHRVLPPSGLASVKHSCDIWFLKYSGNDSIKFYEYFNKLSYVATKYSKVVRSSFIKGNQVFRKVKKVSFKPYNGVVYNLSVAGDNSFVANGLATHNCVPYLVWDDEFNCFTRAELINPDYIDVRGHPLVTSGGESYRYELIPDQTIRDFLNSEHPDDKELRRNMDSDLVSAIRAGRNIRLDNFLVSMVARKQHRYEPRGTSIVLRCFVPGTGVVMSDGTSKLIETVSVGEKVWTHKGRVREVEDTVCLDYNGELVGIRTHISDEPIWATSDHKFFVHVERCTECGQELTLTQRKLGSTTCSRSCNALRTTNGKVATLAEPVVSIESRQACDLKVGDYLIVPRQTEVNEQCGVSLGMARLLGYFLAEGCYQKSFGKLSGLQFSFHVDEEKTWIADVEDLLLNEFLVLSSKHGTGGLGLGVCTLRKGNPEVDKLVGWVRSHAGEYSYTKVLSEDVFMWPLELQEQVLLGFCRGDGSLSTEPELTCCTVSEKLSEQLSRIAWNLGLPHRLTSQPAKGVHRKSYWLLFPGSINKEFISKVKGDSIVESRDEIYEYIVSLRLQGLSMKKISDRLKKEGVRKSFTRCWSPVIVHRILRQKAYGVQGKGIHTWLRQSERYSLVPIVELEKRNYSGRVYCLTVKEDHSFCLGMVNICTQNCL